VVAQNVTPGLGIGLYDVCGARGLPGALSGSLRVAVVGAHHEG
jgi:hypothetical protein